MAYKLIEAAQARWHKVTDRRIRPLLVEAALYAWLLPQYRAALRAHRT
ncbi:hypothetical protein [Nocardia acidivorans]|nr:hypothetical protein [Nocardia acidivorans]